MDWSFWDVIWTTFVVFLWITFIVIFVNCVIDVFRSRDLSGWGKAGWLILMLVLPLIGVLIYTIARGAGMAERSVKDQLDRADQLRTAMGQDTGAGPAADIAAAKALLDGGAITQEEFDALKAKALA